MAYYEERHWREHNKAKRWLTKSLLWTAFWTLVSALVFLPLSYLVGGGFSAESLEYVKLFYIRLWHQPIHLLIVYWKWFMGIFTLPEISAAYFIPFLTLLVLFGGILRSIIENPFYFGPTFYGSGRWANDRDLKSLGLFSGKYHILGRWKGKYLRHKDVCNTLCVAAPGNNKTTSVVIPSILETPDSCMIINDPKSELFNLTAGYRGSLGPVFRMYWEGVDDVEKGIRWPCWNPLSEPNLPLRQYDRPSVVEGMAFSLVPDGPEGTDPYWVKAGRAAFVGLALFIVDKVEQARANDYFIGKLFEGGLDDDDYDVLESYYLTMEKTAEVVNALKLVRKKKINTDNYVAVGTWHDLPSVWIGRESSFPMLVDWITTQQVRYSTELKDRRESGDVAAYSIDPWDIILTNILREASYFGYERRALLEINDLLIMPSKQRSSVISTTIAGLTIFKNAATRSKTTTSDWLDLYGRGWKNPQTGEFEPVTVYFYMPPLDISTTSALSTMFVSTQMIHADVFQPGAAGHGPFITMFVLDDLQGLPTIGYLGDAMSVGRWQKASFLVVVQSLSQISAKYGEDAVNIMITNTAAKLCLGTNSDSSGERFKSMTAGRTAKTKTVSQSEGLGSAWNSPFVKNVSFKYEKDALFAIVNYECVAKDKIFMLYQRAYNRPILADRVNYWEDKEMLRKTQMPPPKPMPDYIYELRSPEQLNMPVAMAIGGLEEDKLAIQEREGEEEEFPTHKPSLKPSNR